MSPQTYSVPAHMKGARYLIIKKSHPWKGHVGTPLQFEPMPDCDWGLILELDNGQKTCVFGMDELQLVKGAGQ